MSLLRLLPALTLGLLLSACGGGGGGSFGDRFDENRALTLPNTDRDVRGHVSNTGTVWTTPLRLYAGDTNVNDWRAMVGYNLHAADPSAPNLQSARLVLNIDDIQGDISRLGSLLIQSVDLNDDLDAGDYSTAAFRTEVVDPADIAIGRLEVDVTRLVRHTYARGSQDMDFRIQFIVPRTGIDGSDGIFILPGRLHLTWN